MIVLALLQGLILSQILGGGSLWAWLLPLGALLLLYWRLDRNGVLSRWLFWPQIAALIMTALVWTWKGPEGLEGFLICAWPAILMTWKPWARTHNLGRVGCLALAAIQMGMCFYFPGEPSVIPVRSMATLSALTSVLRLLNPGRIEPLFRACATATFTLALGVVAQDFLMPGCCVDRWHFTLAALAAMLMPLLLLRCFPLAVFERVEEVAG